MSTTQILSLVMAEKTLTGDRRLIMMSLCDSMAVVSVDTAAKWTNLSIEETSAIIDEMVADGWFVEIDGALVQRQLWAAVQDDQSPRRRAGAEVRRSKFKLPVEKRNAIFAQSGFRCHYCGADGDLTIDHKVPMSRGGSDDGDNLVACCRSCNSSKGTKAYDEFIAWRKSMAQQGSGLDA